MQHKPACCDSSTVRGYDLLMRKVMGSIPSEAFFSHPFPPSLYSPSFFSPPFLSPPSLFPSSFFFGKAHYYTQGTSVCTSKSTHICTGMYYYRLVSTCGNSTACCLVTKPGSPPLPPPPPPPTHAPLEEACSACSQHKTP